MDYQCQLTSLDGQRCQDLIFRDTDLCFWHGVWYRTRRQYRSIPGPIIHNLRFLLAAAFLLFAGYGLRRVFGTGGIIWLLLSAFAFAAAFRLFVESVMSQTPPRSTPEVWPKLLALALAFEIIIAIIIALTLSSFPDIDRPLVNLWNNHRWRNSIEAGSLVLASGIAISLGLTAFARKILGHPDPRGRGLVSVLIGAGLLTIFAPDFLNHPLQSQIVTKEFWEAAIGPHVWVAMFVTYLTSFSIVRKNAKGILGPRLESHDHRITGQAVAQSYLAYFLVPLVAMMATRYFMVWRGLNGFFIFFLMSAVLTLVSGILITVWILRRALWREAMVEGEESPVKTKADYEFSSDWSRVLKDFGVASRRLRTATYELVRRADPDPQIDRLTPSQRTAMMVEQTNRALESKRNFGRLDASTRHKLYEFLKKLESDVRGAEEEVAKWRAQIRGLEGEEKHELPAGVSNLLPIPNTLDTKMQIKKALISQIKSKLGIF
jgi:hypothetical protein